MSLLISGVFFLQLIYTSISYPAVFGTTRYGRSQMPMRRTATPWVPPSPYQIPTTTHYQKPATYPLANTYYETYPNPYNQMYAQDFIDDYYYPHEPAYPIYYVPSRQPSKHRYYQTMPAAAYYYPAPDPRLRQYNADYYEDPVDAVQEEIMDEDERDAYDVPLNQKQWYDPAEESNDNTNAAFLQNLMMYNDAMLKNDRTSKPMEGLILGGDDYLDTPDYDFMNAKPGKPKDDTIVKELKNLPKYQNDEPIRKKPKKEQRKLSMDGDDDMWVNWYNKRGVMDDGWKLAAPKKIDDRKSDLRRISSTEAPVVPTQQQKVVPKSPGGQKEVVLLRPSTPVYHPFAEPFLQMFKQQDEEKNQQRMEELDGEDKRGSVYDTIKQLLSMEDNVRDVSDHIFLN